MTAASAAPTKSQSVGSAIWTFARAVQKWTDRNPVLQLQYQNGITALTNM